MSRISRSLAAERAWREEQAALARKNRENLRIKRDYSEGKVKPLSQSYPKNEGRYAGAGLLGRCLDTMASVRVCGNKVRFLTPAMIAKGKSFKRWGKL